MTQSISKAYFGMATLILLVSATMPLPSHASDLAAQDRKNNLEAGRARVKNQRLEAIQEAEEKRLGHPVTPEYAQKRLDWNNEFGEELMEKSKKDVKEGRPSVSFNDKFDEWMATQGQP